MSFGRPSASNLLYLQWERRSAINGINHTPAVAAAADAAAGANHPVIKSADDVASDDTNLSNRLGVVEK